MLMCIHEVNKASNNLSLLTIRFHYNITFTLHCELAILISREQQSSEDSPSLGNVSAKQWRRSLID